VFDCRQSVLIRGGCNVNCNIEPSGWITTTKNIFLSPKHQNVAFCPSIVERRKVIRDSKITQDANITTFGYDASGRNQTQTSGNTVTTDHFTDSSDSASYTTQTSGGVLQQTDTYASAIGDGLNITVSVTASGTTSKAQIVDPLGSVVANITIPTSGNAAGPDSFQSFDEYGNPETPANPQTITQPGLQNFGWAGTANRQTETTGLILMGARVYNPVTGQFTSPDPIPGGNENTYTYPNDPINQNDFTGCWPWDILAIGATVAAIAVGIALSAAAFGMFCAATAGIGCIAALGVAGALGGGLSGAVDGFIRGHTGGTLLADVAIGAGIGVLSGISGGAAKYITILRLGSKAGKVAQLISPLKPILGAGKVVKYGNWVESRGIGAMHGGLVGFGLKKVINSRRPDYARK